MSDLDQLLTYPMMFAYTREAFVFQICAALKAEGVANKETDALHRALFGDDEETCAASKESLTAEVTDEWVASEVAPHAKRLRAGTLLPSAEALAYLRQHIGLYRHAAQLERRTQGPYVTACGHPTIFDFRSTDVAVTLNSFGDTSPFHDLPDGVGVYIEIGVETDEAPPEIKAIVDDFIAHGRRAKFRRAR